MLCSRPPQAGHLKPSGHRDATITARHCSSLPYCRSNAGSLSPFWNCTALRAISIPPPCHPSDFLARWTFLCLKGIRRAWGGLRMGGIATVATAIGADLAARLPRQNKKQREGLALLVATALDVRDVNLMELAAALPRA